MDGPLFGADPAQLCFSVMPVVPIQRGIGMVSLDVLGSAKTGGMASAMLLNSCASLVVLSAGSTTGGS